MPVAHLDRLRQRYGWKGGKYQSLMSEIIAVQSEQLARRFAEIKKRKLDTMARAATKAGVQVLVPDLTEVLPGKSVHVKKAAERGKLLTDSLRAQLAKGLRKAVFDFLGEGQPIMQQQRGAKRGRMNPKLVASFQDHVVKTFSAYTKRDPEIGVPANVGTIAVTEVQSIINEIKQRYNETVADRNAGVIEADKTWRHFPSRSQEPRRGHRAMSGRTIPLADRFKVPEYERVGTVKSGPNKGRGKFRRTGAYVFMLHPHDPDAPISEVASCHCELDYTWRLLTPSRKGV